MRVVLEVLLLGTFIAFGAAYGPVLWRRWRERKPRPRPAPVPTLPERVRARALLDERLGEAVQIRDAIAGYARRPEVGLDAALVVEVDGLVAGLVALYDAAGELERHLGDISEERLARDAAVLDAGTIAAQRRQLEALRDRRQALEGELARAVAGLRQAWLSLLEALAQPGGGGGRVGRDALEGRGADVARGGRARGA